MFLQPASSALSDAEFLAAFHECSLPPACFRHADHLRLAWIHIHRCPLEVAVDNVRNGIQAYAKHLGKPELYHETLTVAWVRLIASHDEPAFDEFLKRNEYRLNVELLHRFWSPERLQSEQARKEWLAPDRMPLPALWPCSEASGLDNPASLLY
jgi:hypothetical protein